MRFQHFATGAEELDFIFLDEPNHEVSLALEFATAEQPVADEQSFMEVAGLLYSELLELSCNGSTHSFDWAGRAHFVAITLLANRTETLGNAMLRTLCNAAAIFFGMFQTLHHRLQIPSTYLAQIPQAPASSSGLVCDKLHIFRFFDFSPGRAMAVNTKKSAGFRKLRFDSIDSLLEELTAIEAAVKANQLTVTGNWSPGQILSHLAAWIEYGYVGFPIKPVPFFLRFLLRFGLKKMLDQGMPRGVRIPGVSAGTTGQDDMPFDQRSADCARL